MNYHNILKCDMLNGEGLRVVLFVSGCPNACFNCQNPQTHDEKSGIPFDNEAYKELIEALDKPYIDGITFCGGSPLAPYNRETVTELAKDIREKFPEKSIWCYTGYLYEELKDLEIMQYLDVLLDGRYVDALKNTELPWVGSENQRVIDIRATREFGKVILYKS